MGLHGEEIFTIEGLEAITSGKAPGGGDRSSRFQDVQDEASAGHPREVAYYRHGGIMQYVLRAILERQGS